MIIDGHCHAWERWPYQPEVPDEGGRGSIEALLWEMDRHGVDRALLVCAGIDKNPDNNAYGAAAAARYPDRIFPVADIDSLWSPTYHTPGAARRLRNAAQSYPIVGLTHYVSDLDDWFASRDGIEFFATAAELGLILSIHAAPEWQPQIRKVARTFPELPILCHHLGGLKLGEPVDALLASADVPNIHLKVSGFHYAQSERSWDFPYAPSVRYFAPVAAAFGPRRLVWGSDFPASREKLTYQQSLEVVRTHCDFFSAADLEWVLGRTLHSLLERRPTSRSGDAAS